MNMTVATINVSETPLVLYTLRRADDALILGHRLSEWCGHAPMLEEDMALANMGLDLLGQARELYSYAAKVEGKGQRRGQVRLSARRQAVPQSAAAGTAERRFRAHHGAAVLLCGLRRSLLARDDAIERCDAGGDRGEVGKGKRLSCPAFLGMDRPARRRHRGKPSPRADRDRRSLGLYRRDVCGRRQRARPDRCRHRDRSGAAAFAMAEDDYRTSSAKRRWRLPNNDWMQQGGRSGRHSEHLGHLLSELQSMPRTFPGATW